MKKIICALCIFILGCSSPATQQPNQQAEMHCKAEGMYWMYIADKRDQGVDINKAISETNEYFNSISKSENERSSYNQIVATSKSTAEMVYEFKLLKKKTLLYYGANLCMMIMAGDKDPNNAITLAEFANACQAKFGLDSNELPGCISSQAIGLVAKK